MPAVFKNFKFTKMDIGDMGCRVGGIKVWKIRMNDEMSNCRCTLITSEEIESSLTWTLPMLEMLTSPFNAVDSLGE